MPYTTLNSILTETTRSEYDLVDSLAYAVAAQQAKLSYEYILMHINKKPAWMPKFIFEWIVSRMFTMNHFRKTPRFFKGLDIYEDTTMKHGKWRLENKRVK